MAEAVVGALRVVLGLDSAKFDKGLNDAKKSTNSFVKSVTAIAGAIAIERHLTAAVESFVGSLKGAITQAEKFGEMSQQFGISVEALSTFKAAADQAGVSIETLGTSMGRLSKAMFEAQDGTGPTANAFRQLGIEIKNDEGVLKSTEQIMLEVADKFSKMEDGANKTALAMAIFGRGGAALIPLLNQGRDALEKQAEKARLLGQVISTETAVAADKFMDTLDDISKVWTGSFNVAIAQSLPLMQALADQWLNMSTAGERVRTTGQLIADIFQSIVLNGITLLGVFKQLDSAIQTTGQVARQFFMSGVWGDAPANFQAGADRIREIRGEFEKWRGDMLLLANPLTLTGVQTAVYGEKAKQAAPNVAKLSDATRDLLSVLSGKEAQVPIGQSTVDKVSDSLGGLPGKAANAKRAYSEMILSMEGNTQSIAKIAEELRSPYDDILLKMAQVQTLMMTTGDGAEILAARMQQLGIQMQAAWGQAFASLAGSIETALTAIAGENKELLAIAKVAGAAQALINAYVAASKALAEGGPLAGPVFAASILAAGLAFVAQIKAVDVGGFAEGGSFTVGGSGGIDSQRVMMSLTPGERVDVHKPSSAGNRDLTISPIRPRDFFRGDTVREMVMAIDDWMKNGGTGLRIAR